MKSKVIAPHKVRLAIQSQFSEPLCFEWGSRFGYVDESGLRKIRRFPGLNYRGKVKLADDYVLVYQNPAGKLIKPTQLRLGRKRGELTFRARIFRIDELILVK